MLRATDALLISLVEILERVTTRVLWEVDETILIIVQTVSTGREEFREI